MCQSVPADQRTSYQASRVVLRPIVLSNEVLQDKLSWIFTLPPMALNGGLTQTGSMAIPAATSGMA